MRSGSRFDRELVGLERSLGFRSNRGISRQSNRDWLPIQAIVQGMKRIAKQYVHLTTGEIRASASLMQEVTDLFEEWAPTIWPNEDQAQPDWLEDPDPYRFEGRYPRRLQYNVEEDREHLHELFYNLVVEKCCNYHSNQLQRARTSQRQSLDYLDSAGETPQKLEPGLVPTESDAEMLDADAAPSKPMPSYENAYDAQGTQLMKDPGSFSFRLFQDYGMPSSEASNGATVKTTESAPPATGISWTPANMAAAPKDGTQEPTPSEAATSDRPDRPTRPKRKRLQPHEEEMLPKKVSGDRKAKKPRWSQIIPLKVSSYHLARLANGERIAPPMPTSPEETPELEDDTVMSTGIDLEHERRASSNDDSLSSPPPSPSQQFAPDSDTITVKRSQSPVKPTAPGRAPEGEDQDTLHDTHEIKSPMEKATIDPPLSNGTSRPQSARPGSGSAPSSRPPTSHRENQSSKPPPVPLTAPPPQQRQEPPAVQEYKWRPGLTTKSPTGSSFSPVNGPHPDSPAPAQNVTGRAVEREADATGGAPQHPLPPMATAVSPPAQWNHIQQHPGQPPRRDPQPLTTAPSPAQEPHTARHPKIPLVEEVLGPLLECPTAREMLRRTPNMSRVQLEGMRQILASSPDAQTNFDVFTAHVYGRREDGPNGASVANVLASAMQPPSAPPRLPPQHVLPSNGDGPTPRPGATAPAPPKKPITNQDVERILGDLATCPTVMQILQRNPNTRRRELRFMRSILRDHPESRTNLEVLYSRLEAIDRERERSPSTDGKVQPHAAAEAPRGPVLSPRVTPGQGNPFNAFDSKQYGRLQQQPQQAPPPPPPANVADAERAPRYSIIRSPPTSEGTRKEAPNHSNEANTGRQAHPPPPGVGAFRLSQTPADIAHPHQSMPPNPPHPAQPASFTPVPHAHPGFRPNIGPPAPHPRIAGPQHQMHQPHPSHQPHPQHLHQQVPPPPVGPGRPPMGQQDVFAVNPSPVMHNDKLNIPIRSTSMQSEQEVQTPQHYQRPPSMSLMSMSPTPSAAAATAHTNTLEDVSIEINWARNLEYSDHLSMDACLHCKTAAEFFTLIEAQMPDELQGLNGNGNRIKEIKVKALTPLQGEGIMPRIKRDEASGRPALRKLIKKLRMQPAEAEIELEFVVVWE